jgi:hypothetical protein
MRNLLLLIVTSFFLNGCSGQSFLKISKALSKEQRDKPGAFKKLTFHQIRERLMREMSPEFLKSEFDSLFFLEKYSLESGSYYGKIWTKRDSVSYVYSNGTFHFKNENLFTRYTSFLVSKWDTAGIRDQEEKYSDMMPQYLIYASMVIKKNDSYDIRTITFKEFFNIERDRFDNRLK